MRKLLTSLLLVVGCVAAVPAVAGPSLFAGASLPTGDFGDVYKLGFHAGAGYLYPVTPMASVGVRGAFNRFGWDSEAVDGHINLIEALAVGKLTLPAGPSFVAGLGLTNSKWTVGDLESDSTTDFTAAAGIGMDVLQFDLLALYHTVSADGSSLDYVTVSAGLSF